MQKALVVVSGDKLGGAEKVLQLLAGELAARGYQVHVIIWYIGRHITGQWDGLPFDPVLYKVHTGGNLKGIWQFTRQVFGLRRHRFDLTISSNIGLNSILGIQRMLGVLRTRRLVVREPSSPFLRMKGGALFKYRLRYIGYLGVDLVVFQGKLMYDVFLQKLRFLSGKKKVVIQNPIDRNEVVLKSAEMPDTFNFKQPYIVTAGRFIPEKGFDLLIEAFARIPDQTSRLVILGAGGPEQALCKMLIDKYNLGDRVLMPGFVLNPYPYFKHAQLCVVSSRVEGFPNILLQMMILNNNVVSTTCAGGIEDIPGIIQCEPMNAGALQAAIGKALALAPAQLGANREIFDTYLQRHDKSVFTDKLLVHL